jgi:tetratricopeptide (TPR) repeat protein
MKPFTILFLSILAAAGTSILVYAIAGREPRQAQAVDTRVDATNADVIRTLDGMAKKQADLEKTVEDLRQQLAMQGSSTRTPTVDIDAAVARALEAHGAVTPAAGTPKTAAAAPKGDAKTFYDKLMTGELDWASADALWREADAAGVTKDLVAMFEQRAKDFPNDAAAHVDLAKALLQLTRKAGGGPEAGAYAGRADKEFDRALEIDDHNWTARFTKAVSLTFWPKFMGKQSEAIATFETLVRQQDEVAPEPHFAETHVMLGNMYADMGQKEKAIAAYKKGLAIFPDNAALKKQLALAQAP